MIAVRPRIWRFLEDVLVYFLRNTSVATMSRGGDTSETANSAASFVQSWNTYKIRYNVLMVLPTLASNARIDGDGEL